MKNKGYLGLLGIPLAVLGIVGSIAFAETSTSRSTPAPAQTEQVNTPEFLAKAKISADTAVQTALQARSGQLRETKLETDDGPLVYSVMILDGIKQYEVRLTQLAGTGLESGLHCRVSSDFRFYLKFFCVHLFGLCGSGRRVRCTGIGESDASNNTKYRKINAEQS